MSARAPLALPALAALATLASCGGKNAAPTPPPVGWQTEEGWTGSCYYPPQYEQLNETERKQARATTLDAMISQWNGGREDGVSFDENAIENLETVLLGRPEKIEAISRSNLEKCKQVMGAGGSADGWGSWIRGLPATLTEGECNTPLDYTMFDYLDIGTGWQRTLPICEGDRVRISGTTNDKYRISDGGPWITVEGDLDQPAVGGELPCNLEGCYAGQLVARFVSEAGVETIFPVGSQTSFTAPGHGEISYRINDTTYFDNTWFKSGSLVDHTAIEISPE